MIIFRQKRVKRKRLWVDNKEMGYLVNNIMVITKSEILMLSRK